MKLKFRSPWQRGASVMANSTPDKGRCNSGDTYTPPLRDRGNEPCVLNMTELSRANSDFLRTLWTGEKMQVTTMNIPAGGEIGHEAHDKNDQLIMVMGGNGRVIIGADEKAPTTDCRVSGGYAAIIPRGVYHNVINTGKEPLYLMSVYSPREHAYGTVKPVKM